MRLMNEEFQGFDPIGFLGNSIYGKTVGIIGMGRIGTEVGRILKEAFHCKILYVSESSVANFGTKTNLENLLSESDIVTIHCPLNIKTKHIINAQNIKLMKPSSYLINTSRGDVIDQEALIKVLSCNQIMGAALDVTSPEPLPKNHPLLKLENVYLLPHIGSASIEARIEMAEICAKNIKDFNLGLTPQNIVN